MQTITGKQVEIIAKGVLDGNIMRHAEIRIDGKVLCGSVVYSESVNQWYRSKMHLDTKYNACILHVALVDTFTNLRIRLQNCKAVETIINQGVYSDLWVL